MKIEPLVLTVNWLTIPFLFFLILTGCAPYRIGNEKFTSASAALQRQNEIFSHSLAEISPTKQPLRGTLLVLLPSDSEIKRNYIRHGDNYLSGSQYIDFMLSVSKNNQQFRIDGIRKHGLFDSINEVYHNGNPASYDIGTYDCMLFQDVDGWYVRTKGHQRPLLVLDGKSPVGDNLSIYINQFVDSLQQQINILKDSRNGK